MALQSKANMLCWSKSNVRAAAERRAARMGVVEFGSVHRPLSVEGCPGSCERRPAGDYRWFVRLFLASASVRGPVQALTDLVGEDARVAIVANALDMEAELERREWLAKEMQALAGAGLSPVELDLRDFYADPGTLVESLTDLDMVWATGGNAFVLRSALKSSGLDELLLARLGDDSLAYGGCSAGACVCGPTLRGIELIDDAHAAGEPIFDGLALVDYSIAPHVGADGEAGEAIAPFVSYLRDNAIPYRALRDGQAIVVRDGHSTTVNFY